MTDPQNDLQRAFQLHQSGQLAAAIALYRQALAGQPSNAHLRYLLGTALLQAGQAAEGCEILRGSLELDPGNAGALNNLGIALKELRRLEEALECFDRAIALQPDGVDAHNNRGVVLKDLRRLDEAVASYEKVIALRPGHAEAHNNRGNALHELRRFDEALASCDQAIALKPDYADAHTNRARALEALGRLPEGIASLDRAILAQPNRAGLHAERALALRRLGRLDEAIASFDRALALDANDVETYVNKGATLGELNRFDEALASLDRALALMPRHPAAHSNRGLVLKDMGRLDEALASFDQAIGLFPEYIDAHNNKGTALFDAGRLDEAQACFDKSIELNPGVALSHSNRAAVLLRRNRLDDALATYDQAIALDPAQTRTAFYKAGTLILRGDYLEGWKLYERRAEQAHLKSHFPSFPRSSWRGQHSIAGQRLFIHSEQGFGDVVQFCRYLPLASLLGAEIIFEVPTPLVPLLSTLRCNMTLIAQGAPRPDFDAYCPVMSLPFVFKTTTETIPARTPYLSCDPAKVARWQERLGRKSRLRVGLAWSGSATHKNDRNRSMRLETLRPLMDLPVEWHSLQKEYRPHDTQLLDALPQLRQHHDEIGDFSDTAALAHCMDVVISVDTSVAHVAGAIGKPVWILLPHAPDYRWLLGRTDSPWYPTARLFRQPEADNWAAVVEQLRAGLLEQVAQAAAA